MSPAHRHDAEQGEWQEMAIAGPELKRPSKLRWRLRQPRIILACGALVFGLWWFFTYFAPPPGSILPPDVFPPYPPPGPGKPPLWKPPSGEAAEHAGAPAKPAGPQIDWKARAEAVKEAFLHAYHGYEKYAMPADELKPLTNSSVNNFNGWGVTMVDSLDTMYLMGLHDEFERGLKLADNITFSANDYTFAPFFETVIRYLGGFLSAYALSGDITLLKRADELGEALFPAFNTTSGFPTYSVNTKTGHTGGGWSGPTNGWLAEVASCQMEFKYLAKVTGKKKYYEAADRITKTLHKADTSELPYGLLPSMWNLTSGQPVNKQITIGALADSAYEYFLKQYLLTNQTEKESLDLYLRSMKGIIANNLFLSPQRAMLYVTDTTGGYQSRNFEHLSCFLPGLLALGAHSLSPTDLPESERTRHAWAAKGLGLACNAVYADQETSLGPDQTVITNAWEIEYNRQKKIQVEAAERLKAEALAKGETLTTTIGNGPAYASMQINVNQTEEDEKNRWVNVLEKWLENGEKRALGDGEVPGLTLSDEVIPAGDPRRDYKCSNAGYFLRPETIESFFVLWRTTGDVQWRERGWAAFEGMQKYARTPSGYATVKDVQYMTGGLDDSMPSYFLAETLKYLFLLFSDESLLPLDKYVFNTEAHPLPVFSWTQWEKEKFSIA